MSSAQDSVFCAAAGGTRKIFCIWMRHMDVNAKQVIAICVLGACGKDVSGFENETIEKQGEQLGDKLFAPVLFPVTTSLWVIRRAVTACLFFRRIFVVKKLFRLFHCFGSNV